MATSSPTRDYNGAGDYLDTGDASSYDFAGANFTVLGWFYADSLANSRNSFVGNLSNNGGGQGWLLYSTATPQLAFYQGGVATDISTLSLNTLTWMGLAASISGSTVTYHTLINNALSSDNDTIGTIKASDQPVTIGQRSGSDYLDGAANHIQIFNRALSASEILVALNSPGSLVNGLIGYWPGYGQRSPDPDVSVSGNSATVVGAGGVRFEACPAVPHLPYIT